MVRLRLLLSSALTCATWLMVGVIGVSALQSPGSADIPEKVYTCPMHPEIVEDETGYCPICKTQNMPMQLVESRLLSHYTCPLHSVISKDKEGVCPICGRPLMRQIMSVTFVCPNAPNVEESMDPGTCPDGTPKTMKRAARAHGNHNPQHGGVFFMAADNKHHVEGSYPAAGLFRMFLYDDYTKPLPADELAKATGKITLQTADPTTGKVTDGKTYELKQAEGGGSLEASLDPLTFPAQMVALIKLEPKGQEFRFDFTFSDFSVDAGNTLLNTAAASQRLDIPGNTEDVSKLLAERRDNIKTAVDEGSFGSIWVSALQAKDLALALELYAAELPRPQQERVGPIVQRVVRIAWLLDAYGDMGNKEQIGKAYEAFASAVQELESAFGATPPSGRH